MVSQEVLNEIDKLTINANKVKAVGNDKRLEGVGRKNTSRYVWSRC